MREKLAKRTLALALAFVMLAGDLRYVPLAAANSDEGTEPAVEQTAVEEPAVPEPIAEEPAIEEPGSRRADGG